MTERKDDVDRLGTLVREAHEAIRDLRTVLREVAGVRQGLDEQIVQAQAIAEMVAEHEVEVRVAARIEAMHDRLQAHADEVMKRAGADVAETFNQSRDRLLERLDGLREAADLIDQALARQRILVEHPDGCLKLPAETLVLTTGDDEFQPLGKVGALTVLPAITITVLTPEMGAKWLAVGEPVYRRAVVTEDARHKPLAGGVDALEALKASKGGVWRLWLSKEKPGEGRLLTRTVREMAADFGLECQHARTPVVAVDLLGRVHAGAGVLAGLTGPTVAVVVVVDRDPAEEEETS